MALELLEVSTQGPPGPPGPPGTGGGTDLESLPAASNTPPSEVVVKQGGAWFRATFEQLLVWLGLNNVTVNSQIITVNGANVTVGNS